MEKDKILKEFLGAVQLRTEGANPLEDIMISLKDHFPPLRDDRLPTSSTLDIDCVVSDLHRLITAMKIHRNALVPVHQLPDDVLSLIFRYYCFGDHETNIYTHPCWSKIMYVCRRWFDLVVHDGLLWSFINADGGFHLADRMDMQIKRSGNYPLSIHHGFSKSDLDIYPLLLAPEIRRIATLHSTASWSHTAVILKHLSASEPNLPPLHTVLIKTYRDTDSVSRVVLPDAFLTLPSLRRLILSDVQFSVGLLPHYLVVLDVNWDRDESRTDIWFFLSLLSHMSNLRILKVRNLVSVHHGDELPVTVPLVNLPKLSELSLANEMYAISIFLLILRIPATCLLHLDNQTLADKADLFSFVILSPLRQRRMTPGVAPLKMLRLEARLGTTRPHDLDVDVDGFSHTDKKLPNYIHDPNTADLSVQFFYTRGKYRNRVCKRLFRAVGKDMQVLHVQNITTPAHQLTAGWWKVALLNLPALVEVRVSADFKTMLNFCNVLSNLTTTHPKSFPHLKAIDVTKTESYLLRRRYSTVVFEEHRLLSIRIAESIVPLVQRLKEIGAELSLLSVDVSYHEWPGWVEARAIAPSVGCFRYCDTEVYNYDALKANYLANRARRMEVMKDISEYEEPPNEEFDD